MKAYAQEGARDFDDGYWLRLVHDGSTEKRLEYCQVKMGNYVISELFRDTLVVFQQVQNWWNTPQRKFAGLSVYSGEWNNCGEEQRSLSDTTECLWKGPRWGEASLRLRSSSNSSIWNSLETQTRCCVLYWGRLKDAQDQGLQFLANEIFCNHDLRHNTSRLHWPCDCSRRRSSKVRTACDTKAAPKVTLTRNWQKPAAGAAAAHFTHKRT